jgi:hypothetical protein
VSFLVDIAHMFHDLRARPIERATQAFILFPNKRRRMHEPSPAQEEPAQPDGAPQPQQQDQPEAVQQQPPILPSSLFMLTVANGATAERVVSWLSDSANRRISSLLTTIERVLYHVLMRGRLELNDRVQDERRVRAFSDLCLGVRLRSVLATLGADLRAAIAARLQDIVARATVAVELDERLRGGSPRFGNQRALLAAIRHAVMRIALDETRARVLSGLLRNDWIEDETLRGVVGQIAVQAVSEALNCVLRKCATENNDSGGERSLLSRALGGLRGGAPLDINSRANALVGELSTCVAKACDSAQGMMLHSMRMRFDLALEKYSAKARDAATARASLHRLMAAHSVLLALLTELNGGIIIE